MKRKTQIELSIPANSSIFHKRREKNINNMRKTQRKSRIRRIIFYSGHIVQQKTKLKMHVMRILIYDYTILNSY